MIWLSWERESTHKLSRHFQILYLHEDGHDMPQIDEITDKEWKKLLSIDQNKRQKFYRELYIWQRVRETDLVNVAVFVVRICSAHRLGLYIPLVHI